MNNLLHSNLFKSKKKLVLDNFIDGLLNEANFKKLNNEIKLELLENNSDLPLELLLYFSKDNNPLISNKAITILNQFTLEDLEPYIIASDTSIQILEYILRRFIDNENLLFRIWQHPILTKNSISKLWRILPQKMKSHIEENFSKIKRSKYIKNDPLLTENLIAYLKQREQYKSELKINLHKNKILYRAKSKEIVPINLDLSLLDEYEIKQIVQITLENELYYEQIITDYLEELEDDKYIFASVINLAGLLAFHKPEESAKMLSILYNDTNQNPLYEKALLGLFYFSQLQESTNKNIISSLLEALHYQRADELLDIIIEINEIPEEQEKVYLTAQYLYSILKQFAQSLSLEWNIKHLWRLAKFSSSHKFTHSLYIDLKTFIPKIFEYYKLDREKQELYEQIECTLANLLFKENFQYMGDGNFSLSLSHNIIDLLKFTEEEQIFYQTSDDMAEKARKVLRNFRLGERRTLAKKAGPNIFAYLIYEQNPLVVQNVLKNPKITEDEVLAIARRWDSPREVLRVIYEEKRWKYNPMIRLALINNPQIYEEIAFEIIPTMEQQNLMDLLKNTWVSITIRENAAYILQKRVNQFSYEERKAYAEIGKRSMINLLLDKADETILELALKNPSISWKQVLEIISHPAMSTKLLSLIASDSHWEKQLEIQLAIVNHPLSVPILKEFILSTFAKWDLKLLSYNPNLSIEIQSLCNELNEDFSAYEYVFNYTEEDYNWEFHIILPEK